MSIQSKISSGKVYSFELTIRELEILNLISYGKTNIEISKKLLISIHTVKAHIRHIIDKLEAKDRANAVAIAIRRKII